jgi:hypothetical protein
MEIRHLTDCVQIIREDSWQPIYPGDPIPKDLTPEQKAEVQSMLKDCAKEIKAQVMEAEAENEGFAEAVAAIEAEEEAKRSAEIRKQLIAAGVIKP